MTILMPGFVLKSGIFIHLYCYMIMKCLCIAVCLFMSMTCFAQFQKVETWWHVYGHPTNLKSIYYIDAAGLKQGTEHQFTSTGTLYQILNWRNDKLHGDRLQFYPETDVLYSKTVYNMGQLIEELIYDTPIAKDNNGLEYALAYQLVLHRKWSIDATRGRTLEFERVWSTYYAKLIQTCYKDRHGNIFNIDPVTGTYGVQQHNDSVMIIYNDMSKSRIVGKRLNGTNYTYMLSYEYYDMHKHIHNIDSAYILPYNVCKNHNAQYALIKITEQWFKDDKCIRQYIVYRSPKNVIRHDLQLSFVDKYAWCTVYDTLTCTNSRQIIYAYDDSVTVKWTPKSKFIAFDKHGKVINLSSKINRIELPSNNQLYKQGIVFDKVYAIDDYVVSYCTAYTTTYNTEHSKYADKLFNMSCHIPAYIHDKIKLDKSNSIAKLVAVQYKDTIYDKTLSRLPQIVISQLDSLFTLYKFMQNNSITTDNKTSFMQSNHKLCKHVMNNLRQPTSLQRLKYFQQYHMLYCVITPNDCKIVVGFNEPAKSSLSTLALHYNKTGLLDVNILNFIRRSTIFNIKM